MKRIQSFLTSTLFILCPPGIIADCSVESFFGGKQECWGRSPQELKNIMDPFIDAVTSVGQWTADQIVTIYNGSVGPIAQEVYQKALIPIADFAQDVGEQLAPVKELILKTSIMLSKAADEIDTLPSTLRTQVKELDAMPQELGNGINKTIASIAEIILQQSDLKRQRAELIAQNLKGKGLKELTELDKTLLHAFDELEQALQALATCTPATEDTEKNLKDTLAKVAKNPQEYNRLHTLITQQCSGGTLRSILNALEKSMQEALKGKNAVHANIESLDKTIHEPDFGYPTFPARLRAIATVLNL